MKKLILSVAMLAAGAAAFAQKPAAGEFTLETTVNLQVGTLPINMFTPYVRGRYFLDGGLAGRVQFGYTSNTEKNFYAENADGTGGKGEEILKSSNMHIGLGAEKHFTGTEKLSPYVGAILTIDLSGASEEWKDFDGTGFKKDDKATIKNANSMGARGGTTIGFYLLAGADYYFTQNIYIGGEFGWGLASESNRDVETDITSGGTNTKTKALGSRESGFDLWTGGVRLGVKF